MNKPNEKMEALAVEILGSQEDLPQEKFGSVLMILMMISIIVNGIRVIQECNKNKKEDKVLLYKQHIREVCSYRYHHGPRPKYGPGHPATRSLNGWFPNPRPTNLAQLPAYLYSSGYNHAAIHDNSLPREHAAALRGQK